MDIFQPMPSWKKKSMEDFLQEEGFGEEREQWIREWALRGLKEGKNPRIRGAKVESFGQELAERLEEEGICMLISSFILFSSSDFFPPPVIPF